MRVLTDYMIALIPYPPPAWIRWATRMTPKNPAVGMSDWKSMGCDFGSRKVGGIQWHIFDPPIGMSRYVRLERDETP